MKVQLRKTEVENQKNEGKLFLKTVPFIKGNGQGTKSTGTEFKYGQMALDMKAIGKIIKLVAKESSGMQMEMSLKENGKMTRPMVMGSMCI